MQTITALSTLLDLIPFGKVVTYKLLADIFCTTTTTIKTLLDSNHKYIYKIVDDNGMCLWWKKQILLLTKEWIHIKINKVSKSYFRKPLITNYYVSLITYDANAIDIFSQATKKIWLLHPWSIIKLPSQYHITLADCSWTKVNKQLLENISMETQWLLPFYFHCILQKPYIDTKKQKVVFWIRLQNNPFLLTLHQCLKKYIPRRATKPYIPHITLGKLLKQVSYNTRFENITIDTMCVFDTVCITANIDNNKDIILFSHKLT